MKKRFGFILAAALMLPVAAPAAARASMAVSIPKYKNAGGSHRVRYRSAKKGILRLLGSAASAGGALSNVFGIKGGATLKAITGAFGGVSGIGGLGLKGGGNSGCAGFGCLGKGHKTQGTGIRAHFRRYRGMVGSGMGTKGLGWVHRRKKPVLKKRVKRPVKAPAAKVRKVRRPASR